MASSARSLVAIAFVLASCSGGGDRPGEELVRAFEEIAAAEEAEYETSGEYTLRPDVDQATLEENNIVIYLGDEYGYCIEGDDNIPATGPIGPDAETWHVTAEEEEPTEGECPNS